MKDGREKKARLNIIVSFACQIVTLLCGLIIPRVLLRSFGSEAYGAASSITQFLAYIALLEGGISGVARAALYKPIADGNVAEISQIVFQIRKFFQKIAYAFAIYVIILAVFYKQISGFQGYDWFSTFLLVIAISISTFAQYFIGITYSVLLQASQRVYITQVISIIATILNTIMVLLLVGSNCNLIVVKFVSSIVFALKPLAMWLYVKKKYVLPKCEYSGVDMLKQRWTGLGQHLAYFLHSNTDIAILTIFADLKSVAIYSVYYMVIYNIQTLSTSFSAGMESLFGDMLAKSETDSLNQAFSRYETMISSIASVLFSTTMALIIPFIRLYTDVVTDANYINFTFAILLSVASLLYCFRQPYHSLIIAAGHFKQTRAAAYGEAIINLLLSVILVGSLGLIGVVIGTVISVGFRLIYYAVYISKNILNRSILLFVRREVVNFVSVIIPTLLSTSIIRLFPITSYYMWFMCGILAIFVSILIILIINLVFYKDDITWLLKKLLVSNRKHEVQL